MDHKENRNKDYILKKIIHSAVIAFFSFLLIITVTGLGTAPDTAKQYLLENGPSETGAVNLVTAIYLGYRAFDTMGETIVLITSVAGVVFLMGNKE